jgi:hypothetical protein
LSVDRVDAMRHKDEWRVGIGSRDGNYRRRIDVRPLSELATLRVYSIKRSASGVSVRSLTVMSPTGAGGDITLTGRTLRRTPARARLCNTAGRGEETGFPGRTKKRLTIESPYKRSLQFQRKAAAFVRWHEPDDARVSVIIEIMTLF